MDVHSILQPFIDGACLHAPAVTPVVVPTSVSTSVPTITTRNAIAIVASLIASGCPEIASMIIQIYMRDWMPKVTITGRNIWITTYQYRMHIATLHTLSMMGAPMTSDVLISTECGVMVLDDFVCAIRREFGNAVAAMIRGVFGLPSTDASPEYPVFRVEVRAGIVYVNGFCFGNVSTDGTFSRRYVNDFPCMMIGGTFFCVIKPAGEESFLRQLREQGGLFE